MESSAAQPQPLSLLHPMERDRERRTFPPWADAAPLGPLPAPLSWEEEGKSAASHPLPKMSERLPLQYGLNTDGTEGYGASRMLQLVASARSTPSAPDQWAVHEFGRCPMSDQRLTKRLARIASAFARQPTATIPQACGGWTSAKAAYRFFENQSVEPEQILQGHQQATLERLRAHRIVLALQDTPASIIPPIAPPRDSVRSALVGIAPSACSPTPPWPSPHRPSSGSDPSPVSCPLGGGLGQGA